MVQKILQRVAFLEYIYYFCGMINLRTAIYNSSEDLPLIVGRNFFHSTTLFRICERTPRMRPYMVVVTDAAERVVAHLLGTTRSRSSALPPFLYSHCLVMGEGEYEDCGVAKEELFLRMLHALTKRLRGKVAYIEFSHLSVKMFGYGMFRRCGYFPIHWLNVHNSLHSRHPEERLSEKMRKRITRAGEKGAEVVEVDSESDLLAFSRLLRKHNRLKPKRYIPDANFFRELMKTDNGKLFLTKYKGKVIGCCACVFSESNAYLWYMASLRKSYIRLHPGTLTIWHTIKYAYTHGYDHISFMDVGLPFQKNPYREFILQFGGKPVSTYRWFRFSIRWFNLLMAWLHRD